MKNKKCDSCGGPNPTKGQFCETCSKAEADEVVINTSDPDWLEKSLECYTAKQPFVFLDGGNLGIKEKDLRTAVSLIRAAKKSGMSIKSIVAALVGIGITAAGVWIIMAAIADPDPTHKLGLLIAAGFILALTGSLGTLAALGVKFEVSARGPGDYRVDVKPQ
jgi:hypothetical protein